MTISSDAVRKAGPFVGNSIATVFAFAFKTFAAGDLSVTLLTTATPVQQLLVLNTDYTVQLNANQDINPGGTVTTIGAISPIPNTQTLTISGNVMPDTQGTDLITPGPWVPDDVEKMVDRAMIGIQQLRDRAIKFPVIDSVAPVDLPPAEQRRNTTLVFDGNGQITIGSVSTVVVPSVAGRVLFGTGAGIAQDANLFWDNTNKRLGIGNAAPTQVLDVTGTGKFASLSLTNAGSFIVRNGATNSNVGIDMSNNGGRLIMGVCDSVGGATILSNGTAFASQIGDIANVSLELGAGGTVQLRVLPTANANRVITFTGANAGTPQMGSSGGGINITAAPIFVTAIGTTASAANAFIDNASSNSLLRSTSSVRYKTVPRDLEINAARDLILGVRPVVFESKSMNDYAGEEHIGFLAEDIAAIDPRFATFDVKGRPDWVQYATFVAPLALLAADHEHRLAALEARIH